MNIEAAHRKAKLRSEARFGQPHTVIRFREGDQGWSVVPTAPMPPKIVTQEMIEAERDPEKKQKLISIRTRQENQAATIIARDFAICILVLLSLFLISTTLALIITVIWAVSIVSASSRSRSHRN